MQIQVVVTGDRETITYLKTVKSGLMDMRKPFKKLGSELVDFFSNDVFVTQGGALGVRWPGLAPSTIKQKAKRYRAYSVIPLVRTGGMKEAFYAKSSPSELIVGNNAPQFVYHQSSAPRSKIPYRPMLAINEKVNSMANRVIGDHVDNILKGRL